MKVGSFVAYESSFAQSRPRIQMKAITNANKMGYGDEYVRKLLSRCF